MTSDFDLRAYFARIGYQGNAAPTFDTLRALHELHPQAIAFENLNPLMHWPVHLDMAALQRKLISERRGGYCYEHNLLFKQALETIGFRATGLAARVLLNSSEDTITPRTHMLLQVDVEDELWIADVGFGGMTLTGPVRLVEHVAQATPHERYQLTRLDGDYALQTEVRGQWRTLYRFDMQEQHLPDYELSSWYLSNHPQSRFVTRLIAARTEPGRRHALLNNELATHQLQGETTRRKLTTGAEIRAALRETFRIIVPESRELDERLEQIATQQEQPA